MSENGIKSGYQTVINGKTFAIEDLTREELIAEVISCIDKLEEIDNLQYEIDAKIEEWRRGR